MSEEATRIPPQDVPRGCRTEGPRGRRGVIAILDTFLSQETTKKKIMELFELKFQQDPYKFLTHVVFPLLPRERDVDIVDAPGKTHLTPDQVARMMDETVIGCDGKRKVFSKEWNEQKGKPHPEKQLKPEVTNTPISTQRVRVLLK